MRVVIPTVPPQSFYNLFQEDSELTKKIQMHCNIRLNHILLEPPLYNPELSYMNNALIQPISRYMNAHAKHVGLSFEMFIPEVKFLSDCNHGFSIVIRITLSEVFRGVSGYNNSVISL